MFVTTSKPSVMIAIKTTRIIHKPHRGFLNNNNKSVLRQHNLQVNRGQHCIRHELFTCPGGKLTSLSCVGHSRTEGNDTSAPKGVDLSGTKEFPFQAVQTS